MQPVPGGRRALSTRTAAAQPSLLLTVQEGSPAMAVAVDLFNRKRPHCFCEKIYVKNMAQFKQNTLRNKRQSLGYNSVIFGVVLVQAQ